MYQAATDLNLDWDGRHTPASVLVFSFFHGHLLWVQHPSRGWEVPGGKIEPGETPEEAVLREAYEEAGAQLRNLQWLGEYAILEGSHKSYKWVYQAELWDVGARPEMSEIVDVRFFHPPCLPVEARQREDVSPIMKDDVYPTFWPHVMAKTEKKTETQMLKGPACDTD